MKFALLLFLPGLLAAQDSIINAHLSRASVSGEPVGYLRSLVSHATAPVWFGYAVESSSLGDYHCCNGQDCGTCYLDEHRDHYVQRDDTTAKLAPATHLILLYHVAEGHLTAVRAFSDNCHIDAGGSAVTWIDGVTPDASVTFLAGSVDGRQGDSHNIADSAIFAISLHSNGLSGSALARFARAPEADWLREKALFWLANSRGASGFAAVKEVAETDPSSALREKTMFDLSLSREPAAIDELIHCARQDSSREVRGQALFWLAQKAGKKAKSAIEDSVDNDPDTEVKKKAVFALSQLPDNAGVPLLIQVCRTNRNPEARKQAMFWLGQSRDPRALEFIEGVLKDK